MTTKTKSINWVDMDTYENDVEEVYRVTFSCTGEDFREVENEIRGYAHIIKRERKANNGSI